MNGCILPKSTNKSCSLPSRHQCKTVFTLLMFEIHEYNLAWILCKLGCNLCVLKVPVLRLSLSVWHYGMCVGLSLTVFCSRSLCGLYPASAASHSNSYSSLFPPSEPRQIVVHACTHIHTNIRSFVSSS